MTWQASGIWKRDMRKALLEAFPASVTLNMLIVDYFTPIGLNGIAPVGLDDNYESQIFKLVNTAEQDDWLLDLLAAAYERRPNRPRLKALAEERGLTLSGPRIDNPEASPFEALIHPQSEFINPELLVLRLAELQGQVCKLEIPWSGATGFLVGPDLVLTNYHAVQPIESGQVNWQDVSCLFDFKEPLDHAGLTQKQPTRVRLSGPDWLVDCLPPRDKHIDAAQEQATDEELDYALIRLEEKIGELPVGGDTADAEHGATMRGWMDTSSDPPMAVGNNLFLLQHPDGQPMRLTVGRVTGFNGGKTRVRYDANTLQGSSGSPCLNTSFQLAALHQARSPGAPASWNQAVPIGKIRAAWVKSEVEV
ncbi:MAG: trypsin-like peptidase domain-containing protein [Candidatus Promineifilaceae bacterium]|jgi:hypothetical protein